VPVAQRRPSTSRPTNESRAGKHAKIAALLTHLADPQLSHFHHGKADVMELLPFLTVALISSRLAQNAGQLCRLATTDELTGSSHLRSFESLRMR
jgi:hypothetical protein